MLFLNCFPVSPPVPDPLPAPHLSSKGIVPVFSGDNRLVEGLQLEWELDNSNELPRSFTVLRRLPGDSVFDVFQGSRQIPPDVDDCIDYLDNYSFPEHGSDSISYCMIAVDSSGRNSDTSNIVTINIVPQPRVTAHDKGEFCLEWESWIRGGVTSWCEVYDLRQEKLWTSDTSLMFPLTDKAAEFSCCLSDSVKSKVEDGFFYAIFISANEAVSLLTGTGIADAE